MITVARTHETKILIFIPESSIVGEETPPSIDYDKLLDNIKDLNVLAGEGISRIQRTTDGARLKVCM